MNQTLSARMSLRSDFNAHEKTGGTRWRSRRRVRLVQQREPVSLRRDTHPYAKQLISHIRMQGTGYANDAREIGTSIWRQRQQIRKLLRQFFRPDPAKPLRVCEGSTPAQSA